MFITIDDETGVVNALLWTRELESQRAAVMGARMMRIEGEIQRSKEDVVHLMARRITDASALLDQLADPDRAPGRAPPVRTRGHPRAARILPRSRDFH